MFHVASIIIFGTALLLAVSGFTLRLRHKYMRRERELETARAALERAHEILRGRVEELEGAGAIGGEPSTARREPASDIEKQRQRVEELATRLDAIVHREATAFACTSVPPIGGDVPYARKPRTYDSSPHVDGPNKRKGDIGRRLSTPTCKSAEYRATRARPLPDHSAVLRARS